MAQLQKVILYSLAFLGLYGTWIRSALNGTLLILFKALHVTGVLPDTKIPIKTIFTGIYWPVDYLLDVLILFFWQTVDGSHPSTSIFGLYFAGQHTAVITTLYIDSYKRPNRGWRLSPTLWLMIFQLTAVATSGPWLALISPLLAQDLNSWDFLSSTDQSPIQGLPFSISIGYLSLVVAMAIPSSGLRALWSPASQQVAVAAWNIFPLFIALSQALYQALASTSSSHLDRSSARTSALSNLRKAYAFAIFICGASHIATLAMTISSVLFPSLFTPSAQAFLHPAQVFRLPISHAEVPTLGAGGLQFMQWDLLIGFLTVFVPAILGYQRARTAAKEGGSLIILVVKVLGATAVVGPGVTLVGLKWLEDELLFASKEQTRTIKAS